MIGGLDIFDEGINPRVTCCPPYGDLRNFLDSSMFHPSGDTWIRVLSSLKALKGE